MSPTDARIRVSSAGSQARLYFRLGDAVGARTADAAKDEAEAKAISPTKVKEEADFKFMHCCLQEGRGVHNF